MSTFQDTVFRLDHYWSRQGCAMTPPCDAAKPDGAFSPSVFFGLLGHAPLAFCGLEKCRRPCDLRAGANPARLGAFYQYQVVLKPAPGDLRALFLASLSAAGLDQARHDLRWTESAWEEPAFGASGRGWQVLLDGMPAARIVYADRIGGAAPGLPSVVITCGMERLCMALQGAPSASLLKWNSSVTYGALHAGSEEQFSACLPGSGSAEAALAAFTAAEKEASRLAEAALWLPAFDHVLECASLRNLLKAAGFAEAGELEARTGALAAACASACLRAGAEVRRD